MLRRKSHDWHWTLKSEYRALYLCKLMFRTVDESGYEQVRHQLANSQGVETRVKLSKKGWRTDGGRRMPREFYPLQTIDAMEPDRLDSSVLLCKFCRPSPLADFVYEIVAYKFDDAKIPQFFHDRFEAMKPAPTASVTAGSVLMATTTPTTGDSRHRPSIPNTGTISLLPGKPAFSVMRSLDPDRWGTKDRATPKLFTSRSMEDLLMSTDEPLTSAINDDGVDSDDELPAGLDDSPAAPHSDDDSPATPPDFAKLSQRRMTEPSGRLLDDEMVSVVNGWSPAGSSTLHLANHAQSLRSREVGVTARFPAALDPIKCRPSVMECSSEASRRKRGHCDVSCQVDLPPKHREPAAEAKPKAPVLTLDLDDVDPNYEDFSWDFGDETDKSTESLNQSIDFGTDCYTITPRDVKSTGGEELNWPVLPPKEFQTTSEKSFVESGQELSCEQHVDQSASSVTSLGRLSRLSSSSSSSLPLPSPPPHIVGPTVHLAASRLSADEGQSDAGYAASVPDSPKDSTCDIEVEQERHEHLQVESEEQQEEEIDDDADSGSYSTSL